MMPGSSFLGEAQPVAPLQPGCDQASCVALKLSGLLCFQKGWLGKGFPDKAGWSRLCRVGPLEGL